MVKIISKWLKVESALRKCRSDFRSSWNLFLRFKRWAWFFCSVGIFCYLQWSFVADLFQLLWILMRPLLAVGLEKDMLGHDDGSILEEMLFGSFNFYNCFLQFPYGISCAYVYKRTVVWRRFWLIMGRAWGIAWAAAHCCALLILKSLKHFALSLGELW